MSAVTPAVLQRLQDQLALNIGHSSPDKWRKLYAVRLVAMFLGSRPRKLRVVSCGSNRLEI